MFILNTNNGLFQHFIPILRGCHSLFLLETLTEITRVIDTHHIGYLRHGILTGGYQLSCTIDTHFLNELDRRQSGQGFQLLESWTLPILCSSATAATAPACIKFWRYKVCSFCRWASKFFTRAFK